MFYQLTRLAELGTAKGLEGWWYPLYQKMLQVYTAGGYAGTQNLVVGPQTVLIDPWNTYVIPDFVVFTPIINGGLANASRFFLAMEIKQMTGGHGAYPTVADMDNAKADATYQLQCAREAVNNPAATLYSVACAGNEWSWRSWRRNVAGNWALLTHWSANFDENTSLAAQMQV